MKRVSDSWPLFTGHWLLARSMKQEASGQNTDTRNLKPEVRRNAIDNPEKLFGPQRCKPSL